MTATLPTPTVRVDVRRLEQDLREHVDGEVRFDAGSRGAYATDASNYRQVPYGVVVPRTVEAGAEAVAVCHRHDVPVTSRGGGTSLAGQACNVAVVIDWSKYCHRLLNVDAEAMTCVVEPGIVLDELNGQLASYGLMVGPRPATHDHCTIGGMIGNNSCGSTAQAYGKMVDSVERLDVVTYDGARRWVGTTDDEEYQRIVAEGGRWAEIYRTLRGLAEAHADEIRHRYPDIPRRVSGYNLDSLLPERGFHVARALVGSEGTLVTVLRAELRLVRVPAATELVVLGFPDVVAAARAVPRVLSHAPQKLEGMDGRLVSFERTKRMNPSALAELPDGDAWLLVSLAADSPEESAEQARAVLADLTGGDPAEASGLLVEDPDLEEKLWKVREGALGATARQPGMPDTWPGWEDSAVAPEQLADYLQDLRDLLVRHGYHGASLYGHFGQGCVHTRIPFDLVTPDGIAQFRAFITAAAHLVARYGGSLSGEHGDGQARGELLPIMYGDAVHGLFLDVKRLFDPTHRMNPGKVVDARPVDADLRLGADWTPSDPRSQLRYPHDEGRFQRAAMRCVGVGRCRHHEGGVMCPSYMVTREEEHSTRGRARLLFEMLGGHEDSPIRDGWRSTAVRDALDLCLACKGCLGDCPVEVDMATYKADFLAHHYAGRLRPRAHYSMGWLPLMALAAGRVPWLVNALTTTPALATLARAVGGIDQRREIPLFADETFRAWFTRRSPSGTGDRGDVLLWPDTFSTYFHPAVARSAVEVLEHAGYRVVVPRGPVCCGLTWISTGQLATARRVLEWTLEVLGPHLESGTRIVGLEPSCTAVFRNDAHDLLAGDPRVTRLAAQTVTLAELLRDTDGWDPPRVDRHALAQAHCHQHAVMGFDADAQVMRAAGVDVDVLDSGCCGFAGNFGMEEGHYDVSVACAERALLPALRAADDDTLFLADGFSCRSQVEQSDVARQGLHLAEVLAAGIAGRPPVAERPEPPSRAARRVTVGAASVFAAVAVSVTAAVVRWILRACRRPRSGRR